MKQSLYGLFLFLFLALPPVANLVESIMIMHMHVQMPLLVFSGILMARIVQLKFPGFFEKWNSNGVPGITLFLIVWVFWMIPRTMDEALTIQSMEIFKFISLPFLAGIPLRDSWKKIEQMGQNSVLTGMTILFFALGFLYVLAPVQLCNNYLLIEQITLGWGFLLMAICLVIYLFYFAFMDSSYTKKA